MTMSWSFQINNGDLQIGSNGLNTVSDTAKLVQDLTCDLLEPEGTDPLHPGYGSVIDGGTDSAGNYVQGIIGDPNDSTAATFVGQEVQRIMTNYQQSQINRNQADIAVYGASTLTAAEALLAISAITVTQVQDQALVIANIQTGTGSLPLTVPFSSNASS
jgi:hypothetical protein